MTSDVHTISGVERGQPPVALALNLQRAHRLIASRLERELARATGLGEIAGEALVRLGASPGGSMSMAALAEALAVTRGAATRVMDRLEGRGLAGRRAALLDRRVILAELTDEGREMLWPAIGCFENAATERLLTSFSTEEIATLSCLLQRLAEALRGLEPLQSDEVGAEP